jgi:hypothetical protein
MPPSIAQNDARPTASEAGGDDTLESSDRSLDSHGGAISTLGFASSFTPAKTVDETHRVAFLVRKAGENGSGSDAAASGAAQAKSRLGSAMWGSLGMRAVSGGRGGGVSEGESTTALGGGGFGIDARRYVEGLLSLNR